MLGVVEPGFPPPPAATSMNHSYFHEKQKENRAIRTLLERGLINFLPLKRWGLLEGGGLFERWGLIEDLL